MLRMMVSVMFAILFVPVVGRGQEKQVNLRVMDLKKGQVITFTEQTDSKNEMTLGKIVVGLETTKKAEWKVDITEVKDGQIQKANAEFVRSETTTTRSLLGNRKKETKPSELVGETMLLQREGAGWKTSLANNKPTDKQTEELTRLKLLGGLKEEFLPQGKVTVGKKWELKPAALQMLFDAPVNMPKGKISGHFKAIEKVSGEECAVLEFDVDAQGTIESKENKAQVSFKGKMTEYISLTNGISLKSLVDGTLGMSWKATGPDGNEIDVNNTGKLKQVLTAKVK